jgi:hypothetical protein
LDLTLIDFGADLLVGMRRATSTELGARSRHIEQHLALRAC